MKVFDLDSMALQHGPAPVPVIKPRPRRVAVQDLAAAKDPDALLTVRTVAALTGFAPGTLRQWARKGRFPQGTRIGRAVRWRTRDVRAWMEASGITQRA